MNDNIFDYYDYSGLAGKEKIFQMEAPRIKFGMGVMEEVGEEARVLGMKRVAIITDERVAKTSPMGILENSLKKYQVEYVIYNQCLVEPTDESFHQATEFVKGENIDGIITLGGGSVIDTGKAANLYDSYPAPLLTYVNAPIGEAKPIPGSLKPHISCPTTFGTASDCTGISIFDYLEMKAKTGIVSKHLRPSLSILDPQNLYSLPPMVIAANGFDVFSHACESFTARPFTSRDYPDSVTKRPLSQGANPYSDFSCLNAIKIVGTHLEQTVSDPSYHLGYQHLMFAGMLAGIGFGNAGCHLPHGMSYAVAGLVKDYQSEGWPDYPLVPHGLSVIVNSPAVFKRTASECPPQHLYRYRDVATYMGADFSHIDSNNPEEVGELFKNQLIKMMQATNMPNGLKGVGYDESDLEELTNCSFPQKRLLNNAPIDVDRDTLKQLFADSLSYW